MAITGSSSRLHPGASGIEAPAAGAPAASDRQLSSAYGILGFLLPLLAGGNDFAVLDSATAMACFSLAAVGFVARSSARELSSPSPAQPNGMVWLTVFLAWWLGNFISRPAGPHAAMDTAGLSCAALLYAAASRTNPLPDAIRPLAKGLVWGAALTTIQAHYQYWIAIPGLQSWMPAHGFPPPYAAANANFYSANCYAPFLASAMLLGAGVAWSEPSRRRRIVACMPLLVLAVGLLLTKSRSTIALLALAGLGLVLSVDQNRLRHARWIVVFAIAMAAVLAGLAWATTDLAELWSSALLGRVAIWRASLAMIRDHWAFGVGLDGFGEFFPAYQVTAYYTRYPHDLLLEVFAETGIMGFVSLAGFLAVSLRSIGRRERASTDASSHPLRGLEPRSFAIAAVGLSLAHVLVDIDWRAPANPILTFLLLALLSK